jgi:hypothetical protein
MNSSLSANDFHGNVPSTHPLGVVDTQTQKETALQQPASKNN